MDRELYEARLAEYQDELLHGIVARKHRDSARSVPLSHDWVIQRSDGYAYCIEVLAKMAGQGDALAQVAHRIIPVVPLYTTNHEATAKVWDAAYRAIEEGYDDVIGRAGPEGGRPKRPFTLVEVIRIQLFLLEATAKMNTGLRASVGWTLDELCKRNGIDYGHMPYLGADTRAWKEGATA